MKKIIFTLLGLLMITSPAQLRMNTFPSFVRVLFGNM